MKKIERPNTRSSQSFYLFLCIFSRKSEQQGIFQIIVQ
ncbi:hypothetical protein CUZ89_2292 [Enterococcus xinjiangensis]|nr:hypothetical protein M7W_1422 [Enterococcus faecium ATCC 8459 = NRRL B-2354]MBK4788510.1 hypothetical protein [Enterococcus faecium]MBK4795076.1 hypothetical protein [Enterococcus faecium]MBK4875748.1 hypothetical protein [Enterococcus faecium]MBL5004108.1 hypothetical protein [Enterococcus lactis]